MGVAVTLTYGDWVETYPEFLATVTSEMFNQYLTIAESFHRNDGGGPVRTAQQQTTLLGMMVAHIAKLFTPPPGGQQGSDLVGRINNASEGSVSVQAEMPESTAAIQAWLNQTKYGAMYWAATAPYRTFRYRRPRPRTFDYPSPFWWWAAPW